MREDYTTREIEDEVRENTEVGFGRVNRMMGECLTCIHRRPVEGTHHISCSKPDPNMKGHPHGIRKGWFIYPYEYDPIWKIRLCDNYSSSILSGDNGVFSR